MKSKTIIILTFFNSLIYSQDQIGEGLHTDDLINYLYNNYKTNIVLSYNNARDTLYSKIDINQNYVYGIYTNYSVILNPNEDPSTYLYENGIDCEHIWPQSLYEGTQPMKSDLHHLRPCKSNVNGSRGNKPYNESSDNQTQTWYWLDYALNDPPNQNRDKYSESASTLFEPREEVKGDLARTIFYFYTMYSDISNQEFFDLQKEILYDWHQMDEITNHEINRTLDIADYQDYPNPFIIDDTLIQRCYFVEEYIIGDVNQDLIINILDIVLLMNYILDLIELNEDQLELGDLNSDNGINILDIVLLIEEIIS